MTKVRKQTHRGDAPRTGRRRGQEERSPDKKRRGQEVEKKRGKKLEANNSSNSLSGLNGKKIEKMKSKVKRRCEWGTVSQLYIDYHDNEWGVPIHDDRTLFEFLILEGAGRAELGNRFKEKRKLSEGI